MTPKQQARQADKLARALAKRDTVHLYAWDDERGRFVILAPANMGGGIVATLEATDVETVCRQAHAIVRALDRVKP